MPPPSRRHSTSVQPADPKTAARSSGPGKRRVRRSTGQHLPRKRHEAVEPEAKERPEEAPRPRDLQTGEPASRARDTRELVQARFQIGQVADPEADGDRLELSSLEWEARRIGLHPLDVRGLAARPFQHGSREIDPDDVSAGVPAGQREIAGAATRIENAVARPNDCVRSQATPAAVEAQSHRAVHRVVDRRDAVEHRPHIGWSENPAAHA